MSLAVVWIDRENARLFKFSEEKMERQAFHARHTDHHTHRADALDWAKHERAFFEEVASHLAQSAKLLVLGPGVAKHHFMNYLREHVPALTRRVVGCESVDHPTDSQIAALAKRFL